MNNTIKQPSYIQQRKQFIRQRLVSNTIRIVPMCLLLGSCMEYFMLRTGFYDVVKRKEAERLIELENELKHSKHKNVKQNT